MYTYIYICIWRFDQPFSGHIVEYHSVSVEYLAMNMKLGCIPRRVCRKTSLAWFTSSRGSPVDTRKKNVCPKYVQGKSQLYDPFKLRSTLSNYIPRISPFYHKMD